MITAITPTGDRPLAFALLQKWVENQTKKIDQWIVVDDGKGVMGLLHLPQDRVITYVRREPQPGEPPHTLLLNLKAALPHILGDKIIILEDDEYYAPAYAEGMAAAMDAFEVVGLGLSKYYHLPTGCYGVPGTRRHASLAQTAFRSSFLSEFAQLLVGDPYLDMRLWRQAGKRGHVFVDDDAPIYLGIKGLPGRPGIGAGHNPRIYRTRDHSGRPQLAAWVPKDYQVYMDILSGKLTTENVKDYFTWA